MQKVNRCKRVYAIIVSNKKGEVRTLRTWPIWSKLNSITPYGLITYKKFWSWQTDRQRKRKEKRRKKIVFI